MGTIFVNKNKQVRSGWKISSTFFSFFIGVNILVSIFEIIYASIMVATKKITPEEMINFLKSITGLNTGFGIFLSILQCIIMIFFVVLFWKVYDKKPIGDIGLINIKKGYMDLLKGLAYGAISLTIVFIILYVSGNIVLVNTLANPHIGSFLLSGLAVFILVGINEEMFARGYCMTVLKQTGNKWVVIVVSSAIFALMHSLNPAMSWLSYLNLFLFGVFTAYMFIKSKNLWLSIGYHITWNYFEGNIFGFQVSGEETQAIYNVRSVGNNIITGGKFGPEGGLIVTFILVIGFIYLWKIYKPQKLDNVG